MQIDIPKTIDLIKGGLLNHRTTWEGYLSDNPGWQKTIILLAGPLIIGSVILQVLFSRLIGGTSLYSYPGAGLIVALIIGILLAAIGLFILAFAFHFMSDQIGGQKDFNRAFAAVTLASIPGYILGIVGAIIPYLGGLISLAGFIITIVFMWKILPLALSIPAEKRLMHFIVSIIIAIVINLIINTVVVASVIGSAYRGGFSSYDHQDQRSSNSVSGVFSDFARQGELIDAAEADRYEPPADGKLSNRQVKQLVAIMQKTNDAQARYAERMEQMAEDIEKKDNPSFADIGKLYSGIGDAVSATNAEMEVVKTGGGNWAEHQWVKNQLHVAVLQQGEGSEEIEYNYNMYKDYEDELSDFF